jgi:hypothetical protein
LLSISRSTTSNNITGGSAIIGDLQDHLSTGSGATSGSKSILVPTHTNQVLLVAVFQDGTPSSTPVTATYNGSSLTRVQSAYTSGGDRVDLFILANPTTGSHTVAYSGGSGTNGADLYALTYYNVDLTQLTGVGGDSQASNTASTTFATNNTVERIIAFGNNGTLGGSESQVNGASWVNHVSMANGTGGNVALLRA